MDMSLQGYFIVFTEGVFWGIVFAGVIGYIYLKQQSVVTAAVAIILLFAAFSATGVFAGLSLFVMIMQIIVILSITGLILVFLTRWRR